jgi:hypothetical protein
VVGIIYGTGSNHKKIKFKAESQEDEVFLRKIRFFSEKLGYP